MKNRSVAVRLRSLRFQTATLCKLLLLLSNWSKVAVPPLRSLRFSKSPGFPNGCGSVAERAVHPHTPIRLLGVLVGTPRLKENFALPLAGPFKRAKQANGLEFFLASTGRAAKPRADSRLDLVTKPRDKRIAYPSYDAYHQRFQQLTQPCRVPVAFSGGILYAGHRTKLEAPICQIVTPWWWNDR